MPLQSIHSTRRRPLRLTTWRVVEAQHQVSTRKLVDTLEEQALLEDLIDSAKPPSRHPRLHYLLSTPFRYPPLRHGSRFGTRHAPGLWYGSESAATAFAEVAYYRFVFLEGTHADLGAVTTVLTAFTARVRTERGIDLTARPFAAHRAVLASPISYVDTQALGGAMREAGVEAVRYHSARADGVNVGVFAPQVFRGVVPRTLETWHSVAASHRVELVRRDYFTPAQHTFARDAFLVDGRLPAPAL
ncbi:MAG: RES family NAD+ phosphorylase [Vicinamibacterales bacterium]|nr:RES family NAD+ phosphorylase [Vicinamibacterales bacterium]